MSKTQPITLLQTGVQDWSEYYQALKQADECWADWYAGEPYTYGVFSGQSTYLKTIKDGQRVVRSDWGSLTRDDYEIAMGLVGPEGYDYGLLGSMKGAGRARHLFLTGTPGQLREIGNMLAPVVQASRSEMAGVAREAAEDITSLSGISMGIATRLLALSRPDSLVSVNERSKRNLAVVTGIAMHRLQCPAGYAELVRWTLEQGWWTNGHRLTGMNLLRGTPAPRSSTAS